jgi:hypothetical protein
MYLLVPIATVVCLMVGNIVLRAIDGATKATTSGSASDMLFMSAAYNANKLRDDDQDEALDTLKTMIEKGWLETNDAHQTTELQERFYSSPLGVNNQ